MIYHYYFPSDFADFSSLLFNDLRQTQFGLHQGFGKEEDRTGVDLCLQFLLKAVAFDAPYQLSKW